MRFLPMTKTKTILGILLAAVFAVSMMMLPISATSTIQEVEESTSNGKTLVLTADSSIDVVNFSGFAFPTQNGFLGITSHGGVLDSVGQDNKDDASFHTHFVKAEASTNCPDGVQVTHASKNTVGDVTTLDNVLVVSSANLGLTGDVTGDAFAFTLDSGPNGALCLHSHL